MKIKATLVVILIVAFITSSCAPVVAQTAESTDDTSPPANSVLGWNVLQEENATEPQSVTIFLRGSGDGQLTPEPPQNATENSARPPYYGGGRTTTAWLIGRWYTTQLKGRLSIDGDVSVKVWARGTGQSVFFYVNLYKNDDQFAQIPTQEKSISGEAAFTGSDSASAEFGEGDVLGVYVYGGCTFSPNNNWEMVWGNEHFDTGFKVKISPISLGIEPPILNNDFVTFIATVNEVFGTPLSSLTTTFRVMNDVDVVSISGPRFSELGNSSIIQWDWNYKTDKGKSGEYIITIILSYDGENEFRALGTYNLKFPKPEEDKGLFGEFPWLLPLIIVIIIAVVAVAVFRVVKGRRELASGV